MQKVNIFWHRRDLRYADNAGLYYALGEENPVLPVFIFDRNILDSLNDRADARVSFIHDHITGLSEAYAKYDSGIICHYGSPIEAFETITQEYDVEAVYTNRDYEPYAKERDDRTKAYLSDKKIKFYTFKDQVIFEQGEIVNGEGTPYKVFTPYKNKWLEKFEEIGLESFKSENRLNNLVNLDSSVIPALAEMNFEPSDIQIPSRTVEKDLLESYQDKRNFPADDATSRIGIHLRFGTISIRDKVRQGQRHSDTWLSELIWREFYMMILGHYPSVVDSAFKSKYDNIPWINDEDQFKKWCEGKTGYPIVDAGMRELNATGFMHNRVRMIVASFLTKHLLIDWRWGERYFAEKLLDFELSSNNGGWQWAAGTGTDAQPYFRVFNPYSQQDKFDKHLKYIKKWIPEFNSPDYPNPVVDHKFARERAIKTYKEALS